MVEKQAFQAGASSLVSVSLLKWLLVMETGWELSWEDGPPV
jgi:hypothetical protein